MLRVLRNLVKAAIFLTVVVPLVLLVSAFCLALVLLKVAIVAPFAAVAAAALITLEILTDD